MTWGWSARSGITLTRPVVFQGTQEGAVYIHTDLQELQTRLEQYALIVAAVLLMSLVAAWSVSWMAQRSI